MRYRLPLYETVEFWNGFAPHVVVRETDAVARARTRRDGRAHSVRALRLVCPSPFCLCFRSTKCSETRLLAYYSAKTRRRQGSNPPRRSASLRSAAATCLLDPFLSDPTRDSWYSEPSSSRRCRGRRTPSPGLELAKTVSLAPLGCCDLSARPLSERDFSHSTIRSRHSSRSRSRNRRRRQGSNLGPPR